MQFKLSLFGAKHGGSGAIKSFDCPLQKDNLQYKTFCGDGDHTKEQLPDNIWQLLFLIYTKKCGNSCWNDYMENTMPMKDWTGWFGRDCPNDIVAFNKLVFGAHDDVACLNMERKSVVVLLSSEVT